MLDLKNNLWVLTGEGRVGIFDTKHSAFMKQSESKSRKRFTPASSGLSKMNTKHLPSSLAEMIYSPGTALKMNFHTV